MFFSVVIPARDDAEALGALLEILLLETNLALWVVVALNGEGIPAMEAIVSVHQSGFEAAGHRLVSVRSEHPSKIAALNAGDRARPKGPVAYIDADAVLSPGSLAIVADVLKSESPRLAAPRRLLILPKGRVSRSYARIWNRVPNVSSFIGGGFYGVNASGRKRWDRFPSVVGDDMWVFSQFAENERTIVEAASFEMRFPEDNALLHTLRRWRRGNRELGAYRRLGAARLETLRLLASDREMWRYLPLFLAVQVAVRIHFPSTFNLGWRPDRKSI